MEVVKMSMSKEELFKALEELPADQIKLVGEYVKSLQEEEGLDMEAFNYVTENYNETLKNLVER